MPFAAVLALTALASVAQCIPQLSNGRLTGSSFGIPGINATYDYVRLQSVNQKET